jgi:hypothetical protein
MGRRSSDRPLLEDRPPLGAKVLMELVGELAASRGMKNYRVGHKQNAKGEHVVALIWSPEPTVTH